MNKFSLFLLVFSSLIHSNEISFNEVKESDDGSIEISFLLDKVSFIKSYSLIDPSRIVIDLKRDVQADVVMNQLYKFTSLQTSFGINMLALNNGVPELLNLRRYLELFTKFRKDVVYKRTKYHNSFS